MSKPINETGNRYGRLVVLRQAEKTRTSTGKSIVSWVCKCDCGKEITVRGTSLRSGHTKSCGCYKGHKIKNEIGNRYGKLTVISYKGIIDHKAQWLCRCDCGNTTIVTGKDLRNGNTRSCGCIKSFREIEIKNLLIENNIKFKQEYKFDDLINIKPLKFDFAIFKNNILIGLIEYNGEQHYLTKPMGWYTIERINEIKKHDKMKEEYCKTNNIPLLILNKQNYNENLILDWIKNK